MDELAELSPNELQEAFNKMLSLEGELVMGQHRRESLQWAADRIAELERWVEFVRYNSKEAAHQADDYIAASEGET